MIIPVMEGARADSGVSVTEAIKESILKLGADVVGVGDITNATGRGGLPEELKHYTRVISLAAAVEKSASNGSMESYMFECEAAVSKLDGALQETARRIKRRGYRYLLFPPVEKSIKKRFISALYPLFPHRTAATSAGLGWIGKSGLLLNHEYGPRLVWATILTDMPLEAAAPQAKSMCADCDACITACPAKAIKGVLWDRGMENRPMIDMSACSEQMKKLSSQYGRPVCGACLEACSQKLTR